MIDLHTHILCGMDDGAQDVQTSLRMLAAEQEQGVDTVVLTPHFYRNRELASRFLERRRAAWEKLQDSLTADMPRILLGAEVAWVPNLADCDHLEQLCIGNTRHMLLELPYTPWSRALANQIYDLMGRTGITPVLAHLERYWKSQKPEQILEILSLDVPVQISASALTDVWGRGQSLKLLRNYGHVLASDCHDLSHRPPNLARGMAVAAKKLGGDAAEALDRNARFLAGV